MKKFALALTLALATPLVASATPITGSFTTGGSTVCASGPALPCAMTSTDSTFSVLRLVLGTPTLFGDLTSVIIGYDSLLGGIGGGSPRLVVVTDADHDTVADGQFTIHWGPAGSFVDPALGLGLSTGNLLALSDVGRYDLGGIGGSAYTDRAAALTLASTYDVLRLSLVVDSFGGNDRSFVINDFGVDAAATPAPVPEPATIGMFGAGLLGLAWMRRRRMRVA